MIHQEVTIFNLEQRGGPSPRNSAGIARSVGGISVAVVDGTGQAPGFLNPPLGGPLDTLQWGFDLKAVNAMTGEGATINSIEVEAKGRGQFRCSSWRSGVHIYALETAYSTPKPNAVMEPFPLLIPPLGSLNAHVQLFLRVYRQRLHWFKKKVEFRPEEVKAPDTYELLWRELVIIVRTNKGTLRVPV